MRILYVADGRSPTALNWIAGFVERGHEVHLASTFACNPDLRLASLTFVPAAHLRPIDAEETSPLAQAVPDDEKRIVISIEKQHLTAFEGDKAVFGTSVSTGVQSDGPSPNGIPTETPLGYFRVQTKMPSRHMGDGEITDDVEAYELPGVPWVCFFHKDGIALHGTYWHNNFGRRMSHGCVNLKMQDALWIYRWTNPLIAAGEWYARDWGTRLTIQE